MDLKPLFIEITYTTYLQYISKGIIVFWHKELGHNNLSKYVILKKNHLQHTVRHKIHRYSQEDIVHLIVTNVNITLQTARVLTIFTVRLETCLFYKENHSDV